MLPQVDRPLVMSGFYTGVDAGRYRIFQLHQSYLRVSGGDPVFVYCTGGELAEDQRVSGLRYVQSSLSDSNAVSTLVEMARCAAELADKCGRSWIVTTQADIWGPSRDWARNLILAGLAARPGCDVIGFQYGEQGMVARLFAARPDAARRIFERDHAERYSAGVRAASGPDGPARTLHLYENFLLEHIRALGLGTKLVLMPSRAVLKKATRGSRAQTFVPVDPLLTHDHAHDFALIRKRWRPHAVPL